MNILILDEDPKKSAEYHCDMHIKSFVLNYSQLLSSCHWISLYNNEEEKLYFKKLKDMKEFFYKKYPEGHESRPPYSMNYINNPCTHWIRESIQNYNWTCDILIAACNEYQKRYNNIHKCQEYSIWFKNNIPFDIPDIGLTNFCINVPDQYKISEDAIVCYREFYKKEKQFATWKLNNIPSWFERKEK